MLGATEDSAKFRSSCFAGLERIEEAFDAAIRGVAAPDGAAACLARAGHYLTPSREERFARAFRELDDPRGEFQSIAFQLERPEMERALAILVGEMKKIAPDDPAILDYAAKGLLSREELETGARDLEARLPSGDGPLSYEDQELVASYLDAMKALGRAREGYAKAPDRHAAFEHLTRQAEVEGDWETVAAIAEAHLEDSPDCTAASLNRADAHVARQEYEEAHRLYHNALAALEDGGDREGLLESWTDLFLLEGRSLDAWRELSPKDLVFEILAQKLGRAQDAKALLSLTAAHGERFPDDPLLPLWRAEALWLDGQVREATKLLWQERRTILKPFPKDSADAERSFTMETINAMSRAVNRMELHVHLRNRLVHGLVQLDKGDTALAVAKFAAKQEDFGADGLLLLGHVATHDLHAAMEIAERVGDWRVTSWRSSDPVLEAALAHPSMARFREAYPLPALAAQPDE